MANKPTPKFALSAESFAYQTFTPLSFQALMANQRTNKQNMKLKEPPPPAAEWSVQTPRALSHLTWRVIMILAKLFEKFKFNFALLQSRWRTINATSQENIVFVAPSHRFRKALHMCRTSRLSWITRSYSGICQIKKSTKRVHGRSDGWCKFDVCMRIRKHRPTYYISIVTFIKMLHSNHILIKFCERFNPN